MNRSPLPTIALALLCAPAVVAQRPSTGPLPHSAMTYFLSPGALAPDGSTFDHRRVLTRKPGTGGGQQNPPRLIGRPDFTFAALFPDNSQPEGIADIDIDAFSVALDLLWVDPQLDDGVISAPTGDWLNVSFTVAPDTAGAGPEILLEQLQPEGAGGDVFGYVSEISLLPGRYLGQTSRMADSEELRLNTPDANNSIAALDFHVPLYELDSAFTNQLPLQPRVFFSVSRATSNNVPPIWRVNRTGGVANPSGAIVFMTEWSRVTGWSTPIAYCVPSDFGLTDDDDIDALAVDRTHEETFAKTHMVYSTTGAPTPVPSELLFASKPLDPSSTPVTVVGPMPEPYKENDGQEVESKASTGDRVVSVCVLDPFIRQEVTRVFSWGSPTSTPFAGVPIVDESLWASASRSCDPAAAVPVPQLEFWLTGFGPSGPRQEMAICLVAFSSPGTNPSWIPISIQNRNPGSNLGDPRVAVLQAPAFLSLNFQPIWGLWFTLAPGASRVDVSNATMIQF
ncbi:MAG: hypothetical protein AAF196_08615 [Planctomycetota bacterium]